MDDKSLVKVAIVGLTWV